MAIKYFSFYILLVKRWRKLD